jgi:hypothetical protein
MIEVAITNDSTVATDAQVDNLMPAYQAQVSKQFSPVHGIDATVRFYAKGAVVADGAWRLSFADNSDQASALGYHLSNAGVPWSYAFIASDIQAGASWSVTGDHELLEMLLNPFVQRVVDIPSQSGFGRGGVMLPEEAADACEADAYASTLPGADGTPVKLSDWCTPSYWGVQPPPNGYPGCKGLYDFGGFITQPFQILPGGYLGRRVYRGAEPWGIVQAARAPDEPPYILKADGTKMGIEEIPPFSRRHRWLLHMHKVMAGADPVVAVPKSLPGLTPPTALLGPVRNDVDDLVGQASGSLSRIEAGAVNVENWLATMLANLEGGKQKIRFGFESSPVGFSMWLEPKS